MTIAIAVRYELTYALSAFRSSTNGREASLELLWIEAVDAL